MLAGDRTILEPLRCPKGCDVKWVQPLYHEDAGPESAVPIRVEDEIRRPGLTSLYDLGLRCANCGFRYGVRGVTVDVKQALNRTVYNNQKLLKDFADGLDDANLRARFEEGLH